MVSALALMVEELIFASFAQKDTVGEFLQDLPLHSARKDPIGFTPAARRAGRYAASGLPPIRPTYTAVTTPREVLALGRWSMRASQGKM
jgi:hypothetical protein